MKEFEIIADSGGTKTDWVICDGTNTITEFTTESYHPRNVNESFIERAKKYWSRISSIKDYRLTFYGSGCFHNEKALEMAQSLEAIGFVHPKVFSDIEAAARALEIENGWGAICGTGSVVFKVENRIVTEIRGGLGRELGDEGSGFYFGKLVANAVMNQEMIIPELSIDEMNDPIAYSTFAKRLFEYRTKEDVRRLHIESIQALVENHLDGVKNIGFVGSYAFHYQEIFQNVLSKCGISANEFIEKPIVKLMK